MSIKITIRFFSNNTTTIRVVPRNSVIGNVDLCVCACFKRFVLSTLRDRKNVFRFRAVVIYQSDEHPSSRAARKHSKRPDSAADSHVLPSRGHKFSRPYAQLVRRGRGRRSSPTRRGTPSSPISKTFRGTSDMTTCRANASENPAREYVHECVTMFLRGTRDTTLFFLFLIFFFIFFNKKTTLNILYHA